MTIEESLTLYLTTAAAGADVAASFIAAAHQVENVLGNRMFPKKHPEDAGYPAIVYHRISGPRESSMAGPSNLAQPRFQLDIGGVRYADAKALCDKVRVALDGFQGTMGGEVGVGVPVHACFVEDDSDGYDDDLELNWWRLDVVVWHTE